MVCGSDGCGVLAVGRRARDAADAFDAVRRQEPAVVEAEFGRLPLPYDGSFGETFYKAWEVVTQFLAADANVPKEVALSRPPARTVARYLADRREFPVVDVIQALTPLAQPELLVTEPSNADVVLLGGSSQTVQTASVLAPTPLLP